MLFPKLVLQQFSRKFTPDILSSYRKGAGGRSSFNGVVATIFGSTGFVGQATMNILGREGTQIIVAHRSDSYIDRYRVVGDLGQVLFCYYQPNDPDDSNIYKSMKYSNVVINLIGNYFETRNYTFEETHINIPRKLARIARECGVQKFIHVSHFAAHTSGIPGPSLLSPEKTHKILKTKALGEEAVLEEFPNATILKPATLFGWSDKFFFLYSSAKRHFYNVMPLWQKGETTIKNPLYVYDFARIINKIASPLTPLEAVAGKKYYLTGPYAYTLAELIDWMHQVLHLEPETHGYRRIELNLWTWIKGHFRFRFQDAPLFNSYTLEMEYLNEEIEPYMLTSADLGIEGKVEVSSLAQLLLNHRKSDSAFDRVGAGFLYTEMLPPLEYPPPRPLYAA